MMEVDNSETLTVEAIEWPFLKSQREVVDDNSSHDGSADHYEIVVSNGSDGLHFSNDDTPGSDSNFETCLISNADLAALTSTPPSDGIKLEAMKDHQNERVEYDSVQYFSDAGLVSADDVVMTDDQQKLIKVYQTAMESHENKLITVYEIKPEMDEDGNGLGGRDVFVEISSNPEDNLLRGTATISADGTLMLGSPVDGNDLQQTHLTITASMAAAMGLTPQTLSSVQLSSPHQDESSSQQAANTVAELRCTLCGFVSFNREEISSHCENIHDLFLCHACNLVFKRRQSLQSHARAKHGTAYPGAKPKQMGVNNRGGRVNKKSVSCSSSQSATTSSAILNNTQTKFYSPLITSPQNKSNSMRQVSNQNQNSISPDIMLQLPTQPLQPNLLNRNDHMVSPGDRSFELMPDIREILAKNKAVMPNITSTSLSMGVMTTTTPTNTKQRKTPTVKGKRQQNNTWARSLGPVDHHQPLILDSRLSDPATRNQFNSEFAKKITSHGVGAEIFGLAQDRLPALRGTYRLDIKEKVAENGVDCMSHGGSHGETMYSYDIVDTCIPADGCKVICGLCNFSNPRIENVLFHCEIDHKQYFCQNKRCQLGFSSWDSLMRHMKNVHRKDKE